VEYTDLKDEPIGFGKDNRKTTGFSAVTVELTPTVGHFKYDPPQTAIHLEAKADAKDDEFGIEASRRIVLPKGRRYQLQGGGRISEGVNQGADMQVLVRSVVENGKGEVLKTYNGMPFFNQEFNENWKSFVADLSEYAGQEIELVLSLKAKPKYTKIGDTEMLSPKRISADWTEMKIVDSAFRVVFGKKEEKVRAAKSSRRTPSLETKDWSDVIVSPGTEECVLNGAPDRDYYMGNPGESGVNTVKIPGYPSWFAAYTTTPLDPNAASEDAEAYPRMIDFSSTPAYSMFTASATTIKNNVYRSAGGAISVIEPGALYDDDWPNHVAIASANIGVINSTYCINGFVHCEDVYRATATTHVNYGVYCFINYARSSGANIGKSFTKMTTKDSSNNDIYPIISYELFEEELYVPNGTVYMDKLMYGCGSPSIIEKDGYYYMIYHTRALRPKTDWEGRTGTDRYRVINDKYYPWPSITIARATASVVNSANYTSNTNPWKKYYERAASGQEWSQEDGVGGKASILWNSWLDDSDRRSEFTDNATWRAYPKVSDNSWADDYADIGNYMMVCQGKTAAYSNCVLIHNSSNLLDWSNEGIVVYVNDYNISEATGVARVYPTLIGDAGYSNQTSECNMIYYQKDYFSPDEVSHMELFCSSLIFEQ